MCVVHDLCVYFIFQTLLLEKVGDNPLMTKVRGAHRTDPFCVVWLSCELHPFKDNYTWVEGRGAGSQTPL